MRISVEEPLIRPAEVFQLAAACVVLFTSGGQWMDAGAPVDRQALLDLVESLDRSHGFPGGTVPADDVNDTSGLVGISAGSIEWDRLRIEVDLHDVDVVAHVTAHLRGGLAIADHDDTVAVLRLRGHPRRPLHRLATFFGGPVIRHYVRREANKRASALHDLIASMPEMTGVLHRSLTWTFVPDRSAAPSSFFRDT